MQKILIGGIVGMVVGILFGASVVAPRLEDASIHRSDDNGNAVVAEQIQQPAAIEPPPTTTGDTISSVRWNMVSAFPSSLPILGSLPQQLSEKIANVSNGDIAITFHEPGTLPQCSATISMRASTALIFSISS